MKISEFIRALANALESHDSDHLEDIRENITINILQNILALYATEDNYKIYDLRIVFKVKNEEQ